MSQHDETNNTPRDAGGEGAGLEQAIADILQESRRALAHGGLDLPETPALQHAVERAARAARAAGVGADGLFAALDAAVTRLGHEAIPNDGEAVRAAVAALLLRIRVSGPHGGSRADGSF